MAILIQKKMSEMSEIILSKETQDGTEILSELDQSQDIVTGNAHVSS